MQLFFLFLHFTLHFEGRTFTTANLKLFQEGCFATEHPHISNHNFFQQSTTSSSQLFKEMLLHKCTEYPHIPDRYFF
jgi:hypothetical protein